MVSQFQGHELDINEAALKLAVDALVVGTLVLQQHEYELRVHLIDAKTKAVVGRPYVSTGSFTDMLLLEGKLAVSIARKCGIRLSRKDLEELQKLETDNVKALDFYYDGRYDWRHRTPQKLRTALEKFHSAIRMDPNYALAHVGLAESYALLDVYNIDEPRPSVARAKAAIKRALALDQDLASAYAVLGFIKATHDWKWMEAQRDLRRAIELDAKDANSRHWHALVLCWSGQFARALEEEKEALELDSASTVIGMTRGVILYYQREYDKAIEHMSEMLGTHPGFSILHYYRGRSYQQKGMNDRAIKEYKQGYGGLGREDDGARCIG